jgi:hypothetical protein
MPMLPVRDRAGRGALTPMNDRPLLVWRAWARLTTPTSPSLIKVLAWRSWRLGGSNHPDCLVRSRSSAERYGESVVPPATRDTSTNWSMFGCKAISMRRFLALFVWLSLATTGSNSA